jgi:RimJ/RimL family protein N-acetyltransferase
MLEAIKTKIEGENILLKFAKESDRKVIYDMLVSPEIVSIMFDDVHPQPTFEEFDEDDHYYTGEANKNGSYLLIEYENEVIGSISFANCYDKHPFSELDIWLKSLKYTGKGIGTEAIESVVEFVNTHYQIDTFIIRPWIKNSNAIKAYKKAGFSEFNIELLRDFYSDESFDEYGDGDYGVDETVNLMRVVK